jgi:hypothetical protein
MIWVDPARRSAQSGLSAPSSALVSASANLIEQCPTARRMLLTYFVKQKLLPEINPDGIYLLLFCL